MLRVASSTVLMARCRKRKTDLPAKGKPLAYMHLEIVRRGIESLLSLHPLDLAAAGHVVGRCPVRGSTRMAYDSIVPMAAGRKREKPRDSSELGGPAVHDVCR